jgi:hypothetical protein
MLTLSRCVCIVCDQENTSFHIFLCKCPAFWHICASCKPITGRAFALDVFESDDRDILAAIRKVGREMYSRIAAGCKSLVTVPSSDAGLFSPTSSLASTRRAEDDA